MRRVLWRCVKAVCSSATNCRHPGSASGDSCVNGACEDSSWFSTLIGTTDCSSINELQLVLHLSFQLNCWLTIRLCKVFAGGAIRTGPSRIYSCVEGSTRHSYSLGVETILADLVRRRWHFMVPCWRDWYKTVTGNGTNGINAWMWVRTLDLTILINFFTSGKCLPADMGFTAIPCGLPPPRPHCTRYLALGSWDTSKQTVLRTVVWLWLTCDVLVDMKNLQATLCQCAGLLIPRGPLQVADPHSRCTIDIGDRYRWLFHAFGDLQQVLCRWERFRAARCRSLVCNVAPH